MSLYVEEKEDSSIYHDGKSSVPLERYIETKIEYGADHSLWNERPQNIEAKAERARVVLAKLITLLREKNVLSNEETLDLVGMGDWEVKHKETRIVEKVD